MVPQVRNVRRGSGDDGVGSSEGAVGGREQGSIVDHFSSVQRAVGGSVGSTVSAGPSGALMLANVATAKARGKPWGFVVFVKCQRTAPHSKRFKEKGEGGPNCTGNHPRAQTWHSGNEGGDSELGRTDNFTRGGKGVLLQRFIAVKLSKKQAEELKRRAGRPSTYTFLAPEPGALSAG